jgi:hypothetical protein
MSNDNSARYIATELPCVRHDELLERLFGVVASDHDYAAYGNEYKTIFKKLIEEVSVEHQAALMRLDELVSQQEALSNAVIVRELASKVVCQNVCQS